MAFEDKEESCCDSDNSGRSDNDTTSEEFFEGQEKTLEVWFHPQHKHKDVRHVGKSLAHGDLRLMTRDQINNILELAKCSILEEHHNNHIHSFVLSESSLFITATRIILKTCGQTTLLDALPAIITHAKSVGLESVEEVIYTRREFLRPHEQVGIHTSFEKEAKYLQEYLGGGHCCSYGKENTTNQWYLFMLNSPLRSHTHPDTTIEILMSDIEEDALALFFKGEHGAKEVTELSKINTLVLQQDGEGVVDIKEFLFEPCGYSCNGIVEDAYFTLHITPQKEFSFISFETDIILDDYTSLFSRVLDLFRPKNVIVNVLANKHCKFSHAKDSFNFKAIEAKGFNSVAEEEEDFECVTVSYAHFKKNTLTQ
eukprot:m.195792 g.195792  ORF g.195792 m.195792 type:complete len:369 (-) comp13671_c1_seq1:284-1390(-)